jgi:tetratricopeptide (TPR) repeat protein
VTAPKAHTDHDPVVRMLDWIKKHQRTLLIAVAIVVVSIATAMYLRVAHEREENFASSLVTNARAVASSGNVALAMTDLSDLAASHRGTVGAEEAEILLAQLRLSEGQADAAAQSLQEYIGRGPSDQFRASAYGLLAVALEQMSDLAGAVTAYENAAGAAWYDFLQAQHLLEAARVLTEIGDTTQAVAVYRRILADLPETEMVMEARLRLAELVKADIDNR